MSFHYASTVSIDFIPESLYVGSAYLISSLSIQWNYPNCIKSWFRVAGNCFQPPPVNTSGTSTCPPFPSSAVPPNCPSRQFTITNLFNSGVDGSGEALLPCVQDQHMLVLPSQYPFVIDPATLPSGLTPPSSTEQYVGVACNGSVPISSSFTFRSSFLLPSNVAASTLDVQIVLDSPNHLNNILINGQATGLSASAPLISKKFLLTGFFGAGTNHIDFVLQTTTTYMAVMVHFPVVSGCVAQGNAPPGVNNGCLVNLTTNVLACDAEDVCRILKSRGLVFPISSIRKITNNSLNYNCYPDVTPTLQDCVECCDFLVDENIFDNWGGFCTVIEDLQYTSHFFISVRDNSQSFLVRESMYFGLGGNYYQSTAFVNFSPESLVTCSDLGLLETDGYFQTAVISQPVFSTIPAPPIPTNVPSISVPGCCSTISESIQFRHNLGLIPRFSNFLMRNGLVVPGQLVNGISATFIPVIYSVRQGRWVGNLYLSGLSPSDNTAESWSLTIEFGCDTNWRIAIRLFRISGVSSGTFRLVANYVPLLVCAASGFQSFSAAISVPQKISVPAAVNLVINDEEEIVEIVPSALLVQFSVQVSGQRITFPVNLQTQLSAATAALF